MDKLRALLSRPDRARAIPYILFVLPIYLGGKFGFESFYWVYFGRTLLGALLIWIIWPLVREMRYKFSWEAVVVGIGVFVMWVGIDTFYPHVAEPTLNWNLFEHYGAGATMAWFFISVRLLGSTFVVPALEEVFFRSFLYRWVVKPDFEALKLNYFAWKPFLVTSILFGFVHSEWLAGILCGFAYQWLVLHKNRLGDAMTAHAITNFLLALYIVWKGQWQFWG